MLHREGVDDFGAVVGQLGGFFRGDHAEEAGGRDFAGVGGEDAVDFLPNLELGGGEADGAEGRAEVGVAATDLGEERAGNDAEET